MKKFTVATGRVLPLNRANVDTDAILPKQFLRSIKRTGFAENLFDEWRYSDTWHDNIDYSKRAINRDFVLNFPRYQGATILLARENFGCGSSREHAVWALDGYGFRAVIAPSFGDIFYNNCFKNGLLAIKLSTADVETLFHLTKDEAIDLTIDLPKQTVFALDSAFHFNIDAFKKDCLLRGLDEIALTLKHADAITAFENQHKEKYPWVFENTPI